MGNKGHSSEYLVLSRDEVRACDRIAMDRYEIPGVVLMENAGGAAARYILTLLSEPGAGRVCVIAGTGNNAGDGFVVARHLYNAGVRVVVLVCGARGRLKGDALINLRIIEHMDLEVKYVNQEQPAEIARTIKSCAQSVDIIVDAMLGTGTAGAPREPIRSAINTINELSVAVVALDIPSGLDCDTGLPLGSVVEAQHTVTFAAMKKGMQNLAAAKYAGAVTVASIGIDAGLLK
jgi:NAD(P)H-hydrate epimerase